MPEPVDDAFFDDLLGRPNTKHGTSVLYSTKGGKALHRLRVVLAEAQLISEAPSARATQEVRVHSSKAETISPRGTGKSLADEFEDELTILAEKFEIRLAKKRVRPPNPPRGFREWAKHVFQTRGDLSIEALAERENQPIPLTRRAIAYVEAVNRRAGKSQNGTPLTDQQLRRRARNQRYRKAA